MSLVVDIMVQSIGFLLMSVVKSHKIISIRNNMQHEHAKKTSYHGDTSKPLLHVSPKKKGV